MKNMRWQILIVVLALVAIAILLIGQQPTLLPIVPEIKPATGGEYIEGLVGSLGRLNPVLDFYNPADRDIDRLIYSSLVRFDDRGAPVNDLVESMGISQDGTTYNFSLRQGVIWHDGRPLTSDDVVFTIDLLRSAELPIPEDVRSLWEVVNVQALDKQTLQFRLPEPYAPFMDYLTFGILPKHLLSDMTAEEMVSASFNLQPVGSGPYRFERFSSNEGQVVELDLRVFSDYYADPPFIERVVFRYYPDSKAALLAYIAGEIEGISQITPDVLPEALRQPDLNLYTGRLPELTLIFLNLDNPVVPFFQDLNVRRALLMGINRQQLIDNLMGGQAILADGPILPGTWAYYDGIERLTYDPDKAISLLKEAGFTIPAEGGNVRVKEGQGLSFELIIPEDAKHQALGEVIQSAWARLGVEVSLAPVPYDDLVGDYLDQREFEAVLVDLNLAHTPDPDPYPFWHQSQ